MTSHVARLYAATGALVVFFLSWAVVAARPWATPTADPRIAALSARELHLQQQSLAVKQLIDRRWTAYRIALAARQKTIAAAQQRSLASAPVASAPAASGSPAVRVVTLPPLTITKTS